MEEGGHLPSQEQEEGLQPPGASVDIIAIKDEEPALRRESGVLQEEDHVVELPVDVADDDDGGARVAAVLHIDPQAVGLLVEDVGGR